MADSPGRIVEFLIDDHPRLGVVTSVLRDKLQVTDAFGRRHTLSARALLLSHQETADLLRPGPRINELLVRIEQAATEIDTELLWESFVDRGTALPAEELARLYFGESDCCKISAILRKVMDDSVRFRLRGSTVQFRSRDQVEALRLAFRRQVEKEELRNRVRAWLAGILAGAQGETELPEPEQEPVIRRLQGLLMQQQGDDEAHSWVERLDPDHTPRLALYEVLSALGRLPAAADPLLIAAGIDPRFSREALEAATSLAPYVSFADRQPGYCGSILSIDDEDTREIDDAFSVAITPDGYQVFVFIADLGPFVVPEDCLDEEARKRITSIYLPHTTVRMLPERLSCDLASLREGALRPVQVMRARFSTDGELLGWDFRPGEAVIAKHLDYDLADLLLASEPVEGPSGELHALRRLTDALASRRLAQGALQINRPELKIIVKGDSVEIKIIDPASPSRKLIGELMILMNTLAARSAAEAGLPFIYRSQPPPLQPVTVPAEYDPVKVNEVLSQLEKSRLSLSPEPHSALGVPQYTQLTSPLRRYCDLVLQRQLTVMLRGGGALYSPEQLMAIISAVQPVDADVRAAERNANRFYTLSFLNQNDPDQVYPAVVLRPLDRGGFLVETKDFFIRGILPKRTDLSPGAVVQLKIDQLLPARSSLIFREVS